MGWFWESKKQKKSSNEEESIKISESKMIKESEISIDIMPTPNPNALKFLFSSPVKSEGSSTYLCKEDCKHFHLETIIG